jgi:hypothetical protein
MWRTLKPTSEWSVSIANVWVSRPVVAGVWMAVLMVVLLELGLLLNL